MSEVLERTTTADAPWHPRVLARHGASPALLAGDQVLSHRELADRVAAEAAAWPGTGERRLVLVEVEPTIDSVVTYRHDLHPDLALLLSTSGSTGSPKLVRLSADALRTNAVDIASALGLGPLDRGVTTLPLHYCYGLSVLHSHLAVGASVLLTCDSVVDPSLWSAMRAAGVTSLSGVPHTFDLLESSGAPTWDLPGLRLVTQAGGRLEPARVRAWAERGAREGWDLRVMYGQTEATARMAVSAPGAAARHPSSVGMPVGSGRFTVRGPGGEALPPGRTGELHYAGDNVMLGYADAPGDLARGRTVGELATGDLARMAPDGSVEVVGRRSSFLKVNGVRLDVEHLERLLARDGLNALVGGTDERLLALVVAEASEPGRSDTADVTTRALAGHAGLPAHRVGVATVTALPLLPSGKPDRGAVARTVALAAPPPADRVHGASTDALVALYADLLARPDATADSTFVGLGGDSLSYVELSLHLEERIGALPADWPLRPVRTLAAHEPPSRRRWARVDTTIVLRATAILAIVATHTHVVHLPGGAHVLLGVAGYNFARFTATAPSVRETWRRVGGTVARIAAPAFVWVAAVGLLAGTYSPANLVMANWLFGSDTWSSTWRLWFLEALVWILLALAALLSVPAVRRQYARTPFALVAGLAAVAALSRLDVFDLTSPPGRGTAPAVLWLVAIGWAAQVASGRGQRLLLSALVVATLPGFMDDPVREATIGAGLLLVVWVRTLPVPRLLVPAVSALASASLFIYLTHFEVYRATDRPLVNLALGLGIGLAAWAVTTSLVARVTRWRLRQSSTHPGPTPRPAPQPLQEVPR